MAMIFYLAVYCETWCDMDKPWENHVPQAIPAMMLVYFAPAMMLVYLD